MARHFRDDSPQNPKFSSSKPQSSRSSDQPSRDNNAKSKTKRPQRETPPLRLDLEDPEAREIVRQALQQGRLPKAAEKKAAEQARSAQSTHAGNSPRTRTESPTRTPSRDANSGNPPARSRGHESQGRADGNLDASRRSAVQPERPRARAYDTDGTFEPEWMDETPSRGARNRAQRLSERFSGEQTMREADEPQKRSQRPMRGHFPAGGEEAPLPPGWARPTVTPANPTDLPQRGVKVPGSPAGGSTSNRSASLPGAQRNAQGQSLEELDAELSAEATLATALPPGGLFTALVPVILQSWQGCLTDWAPMDKLLADALGSHGLSRGGRGVVVKTLQGLARHHGRLAGALGRLLSPTGWSPEPGTRLAQLDLLTQAKLEVAAWAVTEEGRTPAQAASLVGLHDSTLFRALEHLPRALSEARQVIDRVMQGIHPLDESIAAEALSLPLWLTRLWASQRGWTETVKLGLSLLEPPPLTIRVAPHRVRRQDMLETLQQDFGIEATTTPLSPFGIILPHRIPLHELQPYREGKVEVQDEGSQLVAIATGASPGKRVLDLCAGAGGKILLVASLQRLAGNPGHTLACDPHPGRLKELKKRLQRSGVDHVEVRQADALDPHALVDLNGRMDRVIVDAPCSGLGALRRNPEARWRLQPADLDRFPPLQLQLLQKAVTLLRKGGKVLYATCTLNRAENEALLDGLLASPQGANLRSTPLCADFGSLATRLKLDPEQNRLELLPHLHGTDGFFLGVLEKV